MALLKEFLVEGPKWADGCDNCKFGIEAAPELTRAVELYLERMVQAINGDIVFCSCQAGQQYRVSLLNGHRRLLEEAKRNPLLSDFVAKKSHPDIEAAQRILYEKHDSVPNMHFEGDPA